MCVCAWGRVRDRDSCVYVCVCEVDTDREREGDRDSKGEWECVFEGVRDVIKVHSLTCDNLELWQEY